MTRSQEIGKGYGFAYFAWIRANRWRLEDANSGLTFFMLFNDVNGRLLS